MSDAIASESSMNTEGRSSEPGAGSGSRRLISLDALRGFDMFWIVGGEEVIHALYTAWPNPVTGLLDRQMNHQDWAGIHFYDLIFPLFVFVVGVSLVFSLTKLLREHGRAAALKRVFFRSLGLYIFGLLVYGGISKGLDGVRWLGVLQRIAIAYFVAGVLFSFLKPKALVGVCAGLLVGYWAIATFVPFRDFNLERGHLKALGLTPESEETRARYLGTTNWVSGRFEDGLSLPQHADYLYLPGYRWDGAYDPEGLVSTLGAIATCLLGVFVGLFLRSTRHTDQQKVFYIAAAGVGALVVGYAWGLQFPVIKKLWTSSYVLVAGGYSCLLLAAFYQMIEIWQWKKWCVPFLWIGLNPITIYMIFHLLPVRKLTELVVGGPIAEGLGRWGDMLIACTMVAGMLAIVRFLYNRKIFLRF
jgi:predicted acyltransferase